jgi:hypothetical protein
MFTIHKRNYDLIRPVPTDEIAWSLFCANQMDPRSQDIDYSLDSEPRRNALVVSVDRPPEWSKKLQWIPLVGHYLNIISQMQDYFTKLEDCAAIMAEDLTQGLQSQLIGHRVAVKMRAKTS